MTRAQRQISISVENWPLARRFTIARGGKISADLVHVAISENGCVGYGEGVPYRRYGENIETVTASIEALLPALQDGMTRQDLAQALLPGAARAALDCALWDLQAKQSGQPVWQCIGQKTEPKAVASAFTIVLDEINKMVHAARLASAYPLLKIKLGGRDGIAGDILRLMAIYEARPDAQLIVDVNEGWQAHELAQHAPQLANFGVQFFEQPVPQEQETALNQIDLPFCADETVHECCDIATLPKAYQWINIKLDKAGGLTEALAMQAEAKRCGRKIMVGCMVATSLSMAPALLLAQQADLVDLDGALWLAKDRTPAMRFEGAMLYPAPPELWG